MRVCNGNGRLDCKCKKKTGKKRLDMIAANSLRVEGAGFGGNTNVVTVITKEKEVSLGKMTKRGDSRRTF